MTATRRATIAFAAASVAVLFAWTLHDPRYLAASELDHQAYPLRRIDIDPAASGPGGVEYFGRMRFDLYIGTDGKVHRVEVLETTLPAALLDHVLREFSQTRWQPARRHGREVRSLKRIELEFEPPRGVQRAPMRPDS